jgi:dihydrofolate reductase
MRKIIVQNLISLDGFIAGPNGELDWHQADEEFEGYAARALDNYDSILLGRVTYELFAGYWPTAITSSSGTLVKDGRKIVVPTKVSDVHTQVANKMNSLQKIVFSKTLKKAEWNNTKLLRDIDPEQIRKLKLGKGKDMVIFGSSQIVSEFTNLGLVDEFHLFVNPVVLGGGIPEFKGLKERLNLKLFKTKTFGSGQVCLYYQT